MFKQIINKSFFGAALGTMVEYYDYALFALLLPAIAPLFFPADTVYQSLVKGYLLLFIAAISRPLGGLFFGYLGDTLGRRKALLTSIYGIAFATFAIALTPTYATLGVWAVILMMVAKALQVFCFGGEYNGAGIYVVEHAHQQHAGFTGSSLTAMTLLGSLIASLMCIVVTFSFMPAWSWRLAFALGGLLGVFGILYRKNLIESPHFVAADLNLQSLQNLLKLYHKEVLAAVFIGGFATVPFTTALTFINPVLMTKGFFTSHQLMLIQTLLIFIAMAALIPAGLLSDLKTPKKIIQLSCWALIICAYPLLAIIDYGNLTLIIFAMAVLIIINEMLLGASNAYLKNLFPMQYRYRGTSLGFCIGMSVFGGLTPLIENYLFQFNGRFTPLALWLAFIGVGTLITTSRITHKAWDENYVLQQGLTL